MKRFLLTSLFILLTLTACTPSNYVRLNYLSEHDISQVTEQAPHLTIVQLADERDAEKKEGDEIGVRSDNSPFLAVASVSNWISRGLEQELSRRGVVTRYVTTLKEAENAEHILTGAVTKVWLKQRTGTEYSANIVIKLQLDGNPPTTFESNIIRQDIPLSSITEKTMTEGLRNLLDNAVPKVMDQLPGTTGNASNPDAAP